MEKMKKTYVPIFYDWAEVTEELTAEEKGRMIDAIVLYARGKGDSIHLTGNEKYLFPAFRKQIDRENGRQKKGFGPNDCMDYAQYFDPPLSC